MARPVSANVPAPSAWRFERQVTVGVLVAIVMQTAGALVWAGAASERISTLETRVAAAAPVTERLARLEEQAHYVRAALERIERRLDEG